MIELSDKIPVFNHTTVYTLFQYPLIERFTVTLRIELHIRTNIGIYDVVEFIIVGGRVTVIVL